MKKEDLMVLYAVAQHTIDNCKTIQKLVEQDLGNKVVDRKVWNNDLTRVTTKSYSELDVIEIIMKHDRIIKELEAK